MKTEAVSSFEGLLWITHTTTVRSACHKYFFIPESLNLLILLPILDVLNDIVDRLLLSVC